MLFRFYVKSLLSLFLSLASFLKIKFKYRCREPEGGSRARNGAIHSPLDLVTRDICPGRNSKAR